MLSAHIARPLDAESPGGSKYSRKGAAGSSTWLQKEPGRERERERSTLFPEEEEKYSANEEKRRRSVAGGR